MENISTSTTFQFKVSTSYDMMLSWQQYSPWYMISVDIKDCFDSILSDLLIKLLKQTLTQVSDSITRTSDKISC